MFCVCVYVCVCVCVCVFLKSEYNVHKCNKIFIEVKWKFCKFMLNKQTLTDFPLHKLGIFMPPSRQPMKKHIFER